GNGFLEEKHNFSLLEGLHIFNQHPRDSEEVPLRLRSEQEKRVDAERPARRGDGMWVWKTCKLCGLF
ncbi:hypothetical protein SDJN02_10227, partial [Cucurbita argyrosperma subsp. argyrosperma]